MQKLNLLKTVYRTLYENSKIPHRFCTQKSHQTCWNCGTYALELLCPNCNSIQHPPSMPNYFNLFNIEENYEVNQPLLTRKYRQLQAVLHPDRFSHKSQTEKDISADYSALVNNAYGTLQKPLERGIYMLHLHGERIDESDRGTDPNFLMEIMQLNEEIEEAQTADELRHLNKKSKEKLDCITQKLATCFRDNNFQAAKELIIQLKYYSSVSVHVNSILRERGVVD
ncbi:hypothetical protein PPYR_02737 [Photinus pyralis]|uniref:J domain-containing protein n=1 Tax=Photinus pyralis TaxID=7054 RepID=A0A1Y1LXF8_PHOPY|nr:iron-sulfur cluster co-chaperone protein HscB [Photinus pyralis]XP_031329937.1 iron-sulfur cluster co-chaperone protein HscB [Photinus pyralis]KAB0790937.1 hypothetical protein PPYR_02737 [Photinus pyralis]